MRRIPGTTGVSWGKLGKSYPRIEGERIRVEFGQLFQDNSTVRRNSFCGLIIRNHTPIEISMDKGRPRILEFGRFKNQLTIERNEMRISVIRALYHFACITRQTQPDVHLLVVLKELQI